MNVTTKYEMGQSVWGIQTGRVSRSEETCSGCDGTKRVDVRGEMFDCPKCKGRGVVTREAYGWYVSDSGVVHDIRSETFTVDTNTSFEWWEDEADEGTTVTRVSYMLTRGRSGTVWAEGRLWPSREEAQTECDRRNSFART